MVEVLGHRALSRAEDDAVSRAFGKAFQLSGVVVGGLGHELDLEAPLVL